MKIKLFESFDNQEFFNAIKDCFSHLIDEEKMSIEKEEDEVFLWVTIPLNYSSSINDFFATKEKEMQLLSEIKSALDSISKIHDIDYDVDCDFSANSKEYDLTLRFTPGTAKEGEFYKDTKHGIKIDYIKLEKILDLPKSVDISMNFGTRHRLSFQLKNEEELEKYKDKLIKDFANLKIYGVTLMDNITWSYGGFNGDEIAPYKVYKNYKQSFSGRSGTGSRVINTIDFGLTDGFEYTWY